MFIPKTLAPINSGDSFKKIEYLDSAKDEVLKNLDQIPYVFSDILPGKGVQIFNAILKFEEVYKGIVTYRTFEGQKYFLVKREDIKAIIHNFDLSLETIGKYIITLESLDLIRSKIMSFQNHKLKYIVINYTEIYKYFYYPNFDGVGYLKEGLSFDTYLKDYLQDKDNFENSYLKTEGITADVYGLSFADLTKLVLNHIYKELQNHFGKDLTEKETIIYNDLLEFQNKSINRESLKGVSFNCFSGNYFFFINYKKYIQSNKFQSNDEIMEALNGLVIKGYLRKNFNKKYGIVKYLDKGVIYPISAPSQKSSIENVYLSDEQLKQMSEDKQENILKQKEERKMKAVKTLDTFLEQNEIDISDKLYEKLCEYANYLKDKKQLNLNNLSININQLLHTNTNDERKIALIDEAIGKNHNSLYYVLEKVPGQKSMDLKASPTKASEPKKEMNAIQNRDETIDITSLENPYSLLTKEEYANLTKGLSISSLYSEENVTRVKDYLKETYPNKIIYNKENK